VDIPAQVQVAGDQDMLKRAFRLLLEHLARGAAGARISSVGRSAPEGAQLVLRADPVPEKLVPPVPEERPSGDPTGAVLGFQLAETILSAHQGSVAERDKALVVILPVKS